MKTISSFCREKPDAVFIAGLFLALLFFYPDLFLAKTAMLTGDHAIQHYPWASLLSESLKHFELPFWTSALHCGFPITAEGQIGAFYPPNWLFLGPLPLHWGYSYLHLFHFLVAGWGMYGYARSIKLSPLSAFVTAFVYLFGTVYGGAYYNITSLKTLAWLPMMLLCFERFLAAGQIRYVTAITFASACAVLAGYLQLAVYSLGMFTIYVLLRLWIFRDPAYSPIYRLRRNIGVFAGLALGMMLSAPQLWLTYKLAMHSTRAVSTEEFAYVGSMFPGALMTLLYPQVQGLFRGNSLYLGVLALWFVLMGVCCDKTRRDVFFKVWLFLGLFSFFLALGEWSPFYVAFVKLTHFYAFRTPAKFLFFICFSLSILIGLGIQKFENDVRDRSWSRPARQSAKIYLVMLGSVIGVLVALNVFLRLARPWVRSWGYGFVENFFYGRMGHPHELAIYQHKWDGYMDAIVQVVTPVSAWNFAGIVFMIIGALAALGVLLSRKSHRFWLASLVVIFFADLYSFSWNDLRKDFSSYPPKQQSSVVARLIQEQSAGHSGRLYGMRQPDESLPLIPSQNMLYGIDDIGAYSPLVSRRYLEALGPLGNIDDSNGFQAPSMAFIEKNLGLFNYLNVKHILSTKPLNLEGWTFLSQEDGSAPIYLYQNQNAHNEAHFITSVEIFEDWNTLRKKWLEEGSDPSKTLYLEKSQWGKVSDLGASDLKTSADNAVPQTWNITKKEGLSDNVWELTADRPGFFVRSVLYASEWGCFLNSHPAPVLAANGLFQAVWIPAAGTYELAFHYRPFSNKN